MLQLKRPADFVQRNDLNDLWEAAAKEQGSRAGGKRSSQRRAAFPAPSSPAAGHGSQEPCRQGIGEAGP
jgi:hypothetical protein